jgi:hypothetical protein
VTFAPDTKNFAAPWHYARASKTPGNCPVQRGRSFTSPLGASGPFTAGWQPSSNWRKHSKRHWDGILSYYPHRITSAAIESINDIIQTARRRIRGFRKFDNLKAICYWMAARLDLQIPSAFTQSAERSAVLCIVFNLRYLWFTLQLLISCWHLSLFDLQVLQSETEFSWVAISWYLCIRKIEVDFV